MTAHGCPGEGGFRSDQSLLIQSQVGKAGETLEKLRSHTASTHTHTHTDLVAVLQLKDIAMAHMKTQL